VHSIRASSTGRFAHTDFTFQTATLFAATASRSRGAMRPSGACTLRLEMRAWGTPGARCTRSLACKMGSEHTSIFTTDPPDSPGVPARNGFNGLFRALPGDRACLPPSSADKAYRVPVGPTCLRKLDASVGASGPHDFAVRSMRLSSARPVTAHGKPALRSHRAPDAARVHRIPPRVRDDGQRPSVGRDGGGYRSDLGQRRRGIFLEMGLDSEFADLPVGQISAWSGWSQRVARMRAR
jgi:hypothetical protein